MPDELTSTAGIIALVAGGIAVVALLLSASLAFKLRRLRTGLATVRGESDERDLVAHAHSLQQGFDRLRQSVEQTFQQLDQRLRAGEQRLDRCISRSAVIRYDAYGEMSGRQSSSMALLDDTGSGLVLSSILHREQARMYVKGVHDGRSELELSPEENDAVRSAMATGEAGTSPDQGGSADAGG